jgi:hypothetical protein
MADVYVAGRAGGVRDRAVAARAFDLGYGEIELDAAIARLARNGTASTCEPTRIRVGASSGRTASLREGRGAFTLMSRFQIPKVIG